MGKSRGGPKRTHVSVRLAVSEIERVDAFIHLCSTPWHEGTRSDVLRALLIQGLMRAERGELLCEAELPATKKEGAT
jgi:hypothetical protein